MLDWKQYYQDPKVITLNDLQHAMATLAGLPLVRNKDKTISTKLSIAEWSNHINMDVLSGIMKAMTNASRSEVFKDRQTDTVAARFSGLVPLVLSAYKQYNGTQYSEWDWKDPSIKFLLDPKLQELVPYINGTKNIPQFSPEELTGFIEVLKAKKSLSSYWQVTAKDLPELEGYPRLLKVQLLQVWVAQPTIRNNFMILDCNNLDIMPALITGDIELFSDNPFTQKPVKAVPDEERAPWQ
jgi:hypothetical protein